MELDPSSTLSGLENRRPFMVGEYAEAEWPLFLPKIAVVGKH